MNLSILEDVGLTKSEIEVYMSLLRLGSSKTGRITKDTSMHRSRIYESLNRLLEKGLISYVIKNGIKYFESAPPEKLIDYIDNQKNILNEKEKKIKELIINIKKEIVVTKPEAEASILTGIEGYKTMRNDVLKTGKDLYLIGGKGKENRILQYFFPNFNKMRIKNKIKWHILFENELKNKPITKLPLMECKFLPKGFTTPAVINVYGDRVVNVLWKGDYPLCFMVKNKDIADSYKRWFDIIWKHSK